jgi:polysaccharide biosynthesis protein PslH
VKIVVLSLADPWAHAHGGTLRTRGFVRAFTELGHDVVCVFPSRAVPAAPPVGRSRAAAGEPIGTHPLLESLRRVKRVALPMPTVTGARSRAVSEAVAAERPDVLVVSTLAQATYADGVPSARLWLDMSDLWSEFARREATTRPVGARHVALLQQRQIVRSEVRYAGRAAVVTTAGYTDAQILRQRTGADVHWLPTPLDVAAVPMPDPPPKRAGFIANFAFSPNVDAWRLLSERWLPRLRDVGWEVAVAGLQSDQLPDLPGVARMGPVDDVREFYEQVAVTLAPIRLGGGMKVKVAESLLVGRPVVASTFAVDGFPPQIRALTHVVDLESPDMSALAGGIAPVGPDVEVLSVFGTDSFRDQVGERLDGRTG